MARRSSQKAEALMKRLGLSFDHILAMRFAVNVAIATWITWTTLRLLEDTNPIWAIASMVAASDPQPVEARKMFRARIINVLVGCAVGLLFLLLGGAKDWLLPLALGTTVLISSYVVRIKTMWRQAPITAAVVIAASIRHGASAEMGLRYGLHKIGEVIFGCLVGLLVSLAMSKVWLIQPSSDATKP
ncbi:FUSC family protein [Paraflavitalea sp. CAU 1676]|uniref:FUSC family protein n=1 Tax=Paraflavitalea sp. CAU 1676 TaxID=3032598 RepID=UPI0023DCA345|nr:FUSC family protein [Paraflavitalea sp. CAU 1676]MDF2192719.1 FUSC family protein [Paraflavitalea sp. CAU 1676]